MVAICGRKPPNGSSAPDRSDVPTPSRVTPTERKLSSKVGTMPKMPIDPVIVSGDAQISSDVDAIQYPPDAATPPIDATTGLPACCVNSSSLRNTSGAKPTHPRE